MNQKRHTKKGEIHDFEYDALFKIMYFFYMKNMRKFIKFVLPIVVITLVAITLYPVLYHKYEERLLFIRQLINLLILITLVNYINRSIKKYSFGIYKYFKLLGVTELENVIIYIKNNAFMYFVYIGLFFSTVYSGNLLVALLCTTQFVLYCMGFILISYILMHKPKHKTALFWMFVFICIGYIICFLYRLPKIIISNMSIGELLYFLNKSILMKIHGATFFEINLRCVIAVIILIGFAIMKIIALEDVSVVEECSQHRNNPEDICFIKFTKIRRCGLLRNVKIAFRNKENLLSYFLLFVGYVLSCWLFGYVSQLFFATSLFCIVLTNFGLEGIYLNDIGTFQLYKICGEDFDGFLKNKIKVSILINIVFFSVYTINCIQNNFASEWIGLFLFQLLNIAYWNMYYSYLYSGLNLTRTILYEIKRMVAFVIGLIPVVNLGFVIMYYMKGKRRWNYYVNNG